MRLSVVAAAAALIAGCEKPAEKIDLSPQAFAAAKNSGLSVPVGGEFRIYTWSDYISPDVVAGFEKALGVKVVIDTFDSNEDMYAKIKTEGGGYDLIMPSSYMVAQMAKEDMIEKIDLSRCQNVKKNFDPSFAMQIDDPSFSYSVPYAVTYTGFMYDKNKVPMGADVDSWKILENPMLKGRMTLLDDIREVIGGALMALGHSVNSTVPAEIDAAVALALKWKANSRKFDAESYKTEVADGSTWIGHGYSTDAIQIIVGDVDKGVAPNPDIGFALPKEGFVIAFDDMVIVKGSRHVDLAYAFINYIYDGEVAKVNMEYICGSSPVKPGIDLLDEEYRAMILVPREKLKNGQLLKGFDDPKVMDLYNKAWSRLKAAGANQAN